MFSIEKALPSLGSDCNVRCVKISLEDTTDYNVIKVQPRLNDMKRVERSQSRNGISFFIDTSITVLMRLRTALEFLLQLYRCLNRTGWSIKNLQCIYLYNASVC